MVTNRSGLSIFTALLFAALSVGAPCGKAQADNASLRIGGNGSGLGALKLLAKAYRKNHPEVAITVVPNLGSSGGIAALRNGMLDLAVSSRPLKADEQEAGLQAAEYARTPFVLTAQRNVVQAGISLEQLIDIYQQDDPRWPDGTRVRIILRPSNDTDTSLLEQLSPAMEQAMRHAQARQGMAIATTDQDSLDAVSRVPGALGTAALTEIVTERQSVRLLSFNGVKPNLKILAAGGYPLVKRYLLVTPEKPSRHAQLFAVFLRSAKGREILVKAGNLPPDDSKER